MRPFQNNKKVRRSSGGRRSSNPLSKSYESSGPDVKIRGTASHIAEKYISLARDAQSAGDSVMSENYLQHAEHYFRIIASYQQQNGSTQSQPPMIGDHDSIYHEDEAEEQMSVSAHDQGGHRASRRFASDDEAERDNERGRYTRTRRNTRTPRSREGNGADDNMASGETVNEGFAKAPRKRSGSRSDGRSSRHRSVRSSRDMDEGSAPYKATTSDLNENTGPVMEATENNGLPRFVSTAVSHFEQKER